jgi:hypothetical protein
MFINDSNKKIINHISHNLALLTRLGEDKYMINSITADR